MTLYTVKEKIIRCSINSGERKKVLITIGNWGGIASRVWFGSHLIFSDQLVFNVVRYGIPCSMHKFFFSLLEVQYLFYV